MRKIKVMDKKFLGKEEDRFIYKLNVKENYILLHISSEDIEKHTIIQYIKTPFYLIIYKNVTKTIDKNDYFEVSTCKSTIEKECNSACGIN
ncbi:hypothetical protein ACMC56_00600 [Campylobacterota bacterium DY0563]